MSPYVAILSRSVGELPFDVSLLSSNSLQLKKNPMGHGFQEGSMLMSLHKSMLASYNLYNKTRPSASKSSVARAKQLLEECGGAAQLQSMLHPSFSTEESAKQHGHQPGLEDMSCFHMSPLMFLHITGCLMGWYHFISFYHEATPWWFNQFLFFSGVDIGDEHLIPGYIWMFSISSGQWGGLWRKP